uniref:Uncharacterized protein n=1 Tax=Glossina pallidipes TaxID=7398 RepID=A0A1A9Z9C5_GLOPL
MSKIYSTHPVLASEQLQRTERGANSLAHSQPHHQHRRHNSISGRVCNKSLAKTASITDLISSSAQQQDAVTLSEQHGIEVRNLDEVDAEETRRRRLPVASRLRNNTKDCIDSRNTTLASVDEDDHLQHRFSRTSHATQKAVDNPFSGSVGDVSCISDLSSALTSPSASTVSSPLSTPTRITSHFHQARTQQVVVQSCCQTSNTLAANTSKTLNSSSVTSTTTVLNTSTAKQPLEQQQHLHEIHHQLQHQSQTNTNALTPTPLPLPSLTNGSKNLKKFDPRLGPSPYRQLLPIALCILLFATVFSILIVYMDTTVFNTSMISLPMGEGWLLAAFNREHDEESYRLLTEQDKESKFSFELILLAICINPSDYLLKT